MINKLWGKIKVSNGGVFMLDNMVLYLVGYEIERLWSQKLGLSVATLVTAREGFILGVGADVAKNSGVDTGRGSCRIV